MVEQELVRQIRTLAEAGWCAKRIGGDTARGRWGPRPASQLQHNGVTHRSLRCEFRFGFSQRSDRTGTALC